MRWHKFFIDVGNSRRILYEEVTSMAEERHILSEQELKKLQAVELELLLEFDRICRKNNIIYSIDGGTLLGAIRHGGFIPWDDDADVIMNRDEYEKFLAVVDFELDTNRFYFQDLNRTKGYRWGYGKLRRAGTEFVRQNQEYMPYEQGIFLDVFVCDNVPDNYIARALVNWHSFLYRKVFYSPVGVHNSSGLSKIIYRILSKIPEESIKKSYRRYVEHRNRKQTGYTKCLTFPACNHTYGYKREWYEDTVEMDFAGVKLMGCRNYSEYLTFLYGDYMKLPPEEKRKVHPVTKLSFGEADFYE